VYTRRLDREAHLVVLDSYPASDNGSHEKNADCGIDDQNDEGGAPQQDRKLGSHDAE
jgi:hypothetical protein